MTMHAPHTNPHRQRDLRSGSALLVTLLAVSLLMVIVLTFVVVVRTELRQVVSHQNHLQARANARLGAELALGTLQEQMGVDTRVSAPSSLGHASVGTEPRSPAYTGVWRNQTPNTPSHDPELLSWLISGNEGLPPGHADFVVPSALFGRNPDTDPTVIWLVNTGSVNANAPFSQANPDPRVKAPAQTVQGGGTYAWWVGDEGGKTRVDMTDPFAPGEPEDDSRKQISLAQTSRMDRVPGLQGLQSAVNSPLLDRLNNAGELFSGFHLVDAGVNLGNADQRENLRKEHFHNLTTHSVGLLTDTLRGGLRQDLTWLFEQSESDMQADLNRMYRDVIASPGFGSASGALNQLVRPGVSVPGWIPEFPRTGAGTAIGPTWEQLHSFANSWRDITRPGGVATIAPRTQRGHRQGYGPVLVQAKLFFGLRREASATPGQHDLYVHYFPMFVLANPYTVDLAPGTYHVNVRIPSNNNSLIQVRHGDPVVNHNVGLVRRFNETLFQLVLDEPLPAGEAQVFSLEFNEPTHSWDAGSLSYEYVPGAVYKLVPDFSDVVSLRERVDHAFTGVEIADSFQLRISGQTLIAALLFDDAPGDVETVHKVWGFETASSGAHLMPSSGRLLNAGEVHMLGGYQQRWPDQRDLGGANLHNSLFGEFNMRAVSQKADQGEGSADLQSRIPAMVNGRILRASDTFYFGTNGWLQVASDNKSVAWLINHQINTTTSSVLRYANLLYEVPENRLHSLGQLQHFDPSGFVTNEPDGIPNEFPGIGFPNSNRVAVNSFAYQASHPVGNSRAIKYIPRNAIEFTPPGSNPPGTYRDSSFMLNSLFFDRFFFSTYDYSPPTSDFADTSRFEVNRRLRAFSNGNPVLNPSDVNAASAATFLGNAGAFNVNSTSVPAWKALLSSLLGVPFNGEPNANQVPFPRSLSMTGGSNLAGNGHSENAWTGFRALTDAELQSLAEAVVEQVKTRGPFLSLSDFVNRRLVDAASETSLPVHLKAGLMGTLDAAVRAAGLNTVTGRYSNPPPNKSGNVADSEHTVPHLSTHFPGWITQADLLQPLAPVLSARSDTFRIRAFGEHHNSRAWCEIIVQRTPEFVDDSQTSDHPFRTLNDVNTRFGRRFRIVSFRWLSPEEV